MYPTVHALSSLNIENENASDSPSGPLARGQASFTSPFGQPPAQPGTVQSLRTSSLRSNSLNVQNMPRLRVKIAEEYRVDPPVRPPQSMELPPPISASSGDLVSLELEHRVLEGGEPPEEPLPEVGPSDPYEVLLSRYTDMGYGREEVAMALLIAGGAGAGDPGAVVEAAKKYVELRSMGFGREVAVGALLEHRGDLAAATEACLAAAADSP